MNDAEEEWRTDQDWQMERWQDDVRVWQQELDARILEVFALQMHGYGMDCWRKTCVPIVVWADSVACPGLFETRHLSWVEVSLWQLNTVSHQNNVLSVEKYEFSNVLLHHDNIPWCWLSNSVSSVVWFECLDNVSVAYDIDRYVYDTLVDQCV